MMEIQEAAARAGVVQKLGQAAFLLDVAGDALQQFGAKHEVDSSIAHSLAEECLILVRAVSNPDGILPHSKPIIH